MKINLFIWFIAISLVLSSCSVIENRAEGPTFVKANIPPGKSLIYFYREYNFAGAPFTVGIDVNAKEIARLNNDGYYPYLTTPGYKKITGHYGIYELHIEFEVSPNSESYVSASGEGGSIVLKRVDPLLGEVEISDNRKQSHK